MGAALDHSPLALVYPGLTRLLAVPGFVNAMVDAYWLHKICPILLIPDLTSGEGERWTALVQAVPEMTAFDITSDGSPPRDARQNARRAAVRSLAVAAGLGKQTFAHTSLLGGEPFLKVSVGGGAAEVKLGRCESVRWATAPVPLRKALDLLHADGTIGIVERALCPLLGVGEEEFPALFAFWTLLTPIRHFDARSRYPLLLPGRPLPAVPEGYEGRYGACDSEAIGVPFAVAARIATPYVAKVVRETRAEIVNRRPDEEKLEEILAWALERADPPESGLA